MAVEHSGNKSYPTNSISKEDLTYARPDLEGIIETLSDDEMQQLADRVGEIIKDDYWSAVDNVLNQKFGSEREIEDDITD